MTKQVPLQSCKLIREMPDAHLRAIGEVIVHFAGMDLTVDMAIGKILKVHVGAETAVTVGIGLPFKLDMLEGLALTTLSTGPIRQELLDIISEIRIVQQDRNFIAHAHWIPESKDDEKVLGTQGKKNALGYRSETWSADDITRIAERINQLEGMLLGWIFNRRPRRRETAWHKRRPAQPQKGSKRNARAKSKRRGP